MNHKYILPFVVTLFWFFQYWQSNSYFIPKNNDKIALLLDTGKKDSTKYKKSASPTFIPKDRYGDPFSNNQIRSRLIYGNSQLLQREVIFMPNKDSAGKSNNYFIVKEKIGNTDYRPETILSEKELQQIAQEESKEEFWKEAADEQNADNALSGRNLIPKIPIQNKAFGRIFRGDYVEFSPTGFVNLDFGLRQQRVANPTLPIRQQRNTIFNFDPQANISLVAKVGEALKITGNFDTKASFDFENNFKIEYTGADYQIIQKIEFGNVSFPLTTTLIQGPQNMFGINTKFQFGRLSVRAIYANQRARAEEIVIQGQNGAQRRNFEIRANDYDENRHFFLAHFFRDNYESSLRTLPVITSRVTITRVEVYVTNRVNNTENQRNILGLTDLAENKKLKSPSNPRLLPINPLATADNAANQLFTNLQTDANARDADQASSQLETAFQMKKGDDFEVIRAARRLSDKEFTFHPELGYISLLTPLRNDEVLAVAFEYTFNGQRYKVGELSEDYQNFTADKVIFLKLLRPAAVRLDLPTWDLMMKNIYSLNAASISPQNFQMRIIYRDDVTGIDNPNLQEGNSTKDIPLLRLLGLDRLNQRNDPQRDGNFDFVENVTIDSRNGKIIFPVLEPFGTHLEKQFNPITEVNLINKYVFTQLYRSTRADALQAADKNKFFLKGSYEASASTDVTLPGINISQGSVKVTAGGIPLEEGIDYTVDYNTGKVQVINEAVLASGKEIKINYEKSDLFNFQVKRLWGVRLDYEFNKNFVIGATAMNLTERPVITRTATGDEPTSNTIWGFDINYKAEPRFLTRLVDAIPLIQTKEKSSLSFYGEFAQLLPGASPLSGQVSYIDDFEGSRTVFSVVRSAHTGWKLGATPQLFPQGNATNRLEYTYRRAKMAWYNIDPLFYNNGTTAANRRPGNISDEDLKNHYVRAVSPQEIFQNRQRAVLQLNETIMDLAFFPHERGPYNYNSSLDVNGNLLNPQQNWGAITRAITSDIDFDNANVEYIEFWLLDPFIAGENGKVIDGQFNTNNTTGGDLYLNLGEISEDVMKDGRHSFENGIPSVGGNEFNTDLTAWGRVPRQQFINNAFDNSAGARENQDIGLDGLRSSEEFSFFNGFGQSLPASLNANARQNILNDPSADDFRYFLDGSYDASNAKIVERYKNFNGLENNSPISSTTSTSVSSATNLPDNEDLNTDNTVNDRESYYQYKISLRPNQLQVGQNYIIDKIEAQPDPNNPERVTWYQFRIPIRLFDEKVGDINGFKSIRFLRLFLTNFQQPVVLRMAQFQLVANQWRRYLNDLNDKTLTQPNEPYEAGFEISTVNIEENGPPASAGQTPYVLPPGVIRDQDVTTTQNRQINEQSLRICVEGLKDRDARAAFKNYNLDLLSYKNIAMFIHAESPDARDNELTAFVRLGTDFTDNYYEIEVPLRLTPAGTSSTQPDLIWPSENEINIAISDLVATKTERNSVRGIQTRNVTIPYSRQVGKYKVTVVGNPDLSAVQVSMIGVRNPNTGFGDDRLPKSVCIWANEFRISGFEQTPGWAALGRLNLKLADFAQINSSISYTTFGFGSIQQKISQRTRNNTLTFDISANIALDKFLPSEWKLRLPLFMSYEYRNISPRFNPLDPDVPLQFYLDALPNEQEKDAYRALVEDRMTRRSINLTDVRKEKTNTNGLKLPFDVSNFSLSLAYSDERKSNITIASYLFRSYSAALTYNYTNPLKPFEPFKKATFLKSKYLALIRDFSFNFLPTSVSIRYDLQRTFARTDYRSADLTTQGEPFFEKIFTFNRQYNVQWALTRNLNFNYSATANALIDEPFGEVNTTEKRDSVFNNLMRFGRMKNFTQQMAFTYKVPFDKIPFMEFITANLGYNAGTAWTAGAIGVADTLGNILQNNRDQNLNARIDLARLYSKVKFLKDIDKPPLKTNTQLQTDSTNRNNSIAWKTLLRPLLFIRNINLTYTLQEQTTLPGFRLQPRFIGLDSTFTAPGWDFIFGSQDADIRFRAAQNGWLAKSTYQNTPFEQSMQENINLRISLEPIPELRINIDFQRRQTNGFQEIFRYDLNTGQFQSFNPVRTGSYSISYIGINTFFVANDNALNESPIFRQFEQNRAIIAGRLRNLNTNLGEYGINSQDVLIPAFLAAYSGANAENVSLSAFPNLPLPNWRLDYTGLTKIPALKKIFSNFTISHSYSATYGVGNFTSSLEYGGEYVSFQNSVFDYIIPNRINQQGEFISVNVVPSVNIAERFAPLLGISFKTIGNLTIRFDYNRDRSVSLNLSNAQLTEMRGQDVVFGLGYTKRNLQIPFIKRNGKPVLLKNDVTFRLDFTLRENSVIQRKIEAENTITGGNLNMQIKPIISYVANKRLNLQFYYEYTLNRPLISSSFPRTTNSFGVQLRYSITE
ncbi:MAG: cell surface protein SprA [Cytophagales bacterium]|nr:MAG: cell surface protein SprA [Cytophagales bacterium]